MDKQIQRKSFIKRGLTLIEVLIVIAVVCVLFVVLVSRVDFTTDKAKITGVQNDFRALQTALKTIGIENAEFTDDIDRLVEQLNINLNSGSSIIIDGNSMVTTNKDPWGNHYELNYQKPANTSGQITMGSAGPDGIFGTSDDLKSTVTIEKDDDGSHIVIDGDASDIVLDQNHSCVFEQRIIAERYIAFEGNCITKMAYYFSCRCGKEGTATFYGNVNNTIHGDVRTTTYVSKGDYHLKNEICHDCNNQASSVQEEHTIVNGKCSLCNQDVHEHIYNQETTDYLASDATCSAKAKYYYTCSCGEKGTNTFDYGEPLEHRCSSTDVREATCTQSGIRIERCDYCNYSTETTIPQLSHVFINKVNDSYKVANGEATCKSGTLYYQSCYMCGLKHSKTFESDDIDETNHIGTMSVTYTKKDSKEHTGIQVCNACDKPTGVTWDEGHEEINGTCNKCENHNCYFELSNTDDKFKAFDATCQVKAKYYYSCTCGNMGTNTFEYGEKISHNISDIVDDKYLKSVATCEDKAVYYKSCSMCGLQYEDVFTHGSALGHDEQIIKGVGATCTTSGFTDGITCARCDKTIQMPTIINAYGHTELVTKGVEATCTTSGMSDYIECSVCNTVLQTATIIEALGHDMINEPNVLPTCTTNGYKNGQHCSRCDYIIAQEIIPAVGHIEITNESTLPTCTKPGLNGGTVCETCGVYLVNPEVIPELGHTVVTQIGTEPTCTQNGWGNSQVCDVCDAIIKMGDLLPALGHQVVIDEGFAATCTTEGRTAGSHCSVCNEVLQGSSIVEKIPHNYDIDYIENPTCTQNGYMNYRCVECGDEYQELIDMIEHFDTNNDMICDMCNSILGTIEEVVQFSIDGVPYAVPKGYTWREFAENGPYDNWSFSILTNEDENVSGRLLMYIVDFNNNPVKAKDIIHPISYLHVQVNSGSKTTTLSGTWDLKETLTAPTDSMANNTYNMDFIVFLARFSQWKFVNNNDEYAMYFNDKLVYDFNTNSLNNSWKRVMFSNESTSNPVEVPVEFYNWFIENATRVTYNVSGDWILNEEIDSFNLLPFNIEDTIGVGSYLTSYQTYSILKMNTSGLYVGNDTNNMILLTDGKFTDENNRYISFDDCDVPENFYKWLLENAKPDKRKLVGEWKMNDIVYPYHLKNRNMIASFVSGDTNYKRMAFTISGTDVITTKFAYSTALVGSGWFLSNKYEHISNTPKDTYWNDEKWRTVNFIEPQYVYRSEYEWFVMNASPINENNNCVDHNYVETIINEPQCITPGVLKQNCTICGKENYIPLEMTGHLNTETINAIEATCTTSGQTASITCLDCGTQIQKSTTINALGHDYEFIDAEPATCTIYGSERYKCVRCGGIIYVTIHSIGHVDDNLDGICDICNDYTNSFYITTHKYYYEPNMTFAEWCNSEYNTDNWICVGPYIVYYDYEDNYTAYFVALDSIYVRPNEIIKNQFYGLKGMNDAKGQGIAPNGDFYSHTTDPDNIFELLKDGTCVGYFAHNRIITNYDDGFIKTTLNVYVNNELVVISEKMVQNTTETTPLRYSINAQNLNYVVTRVEKIDRLGNVMELTYDCTNNVCDFDCNMDEECILNIYTVVTSVQKNNLYKEFSSSLISGTYPVYFNGEYDGIVDVVDSTFTYDFAKNGHYIIDLGYQKILIGIGCDEDSNSSLGYFKLLNGYTKEFDISWFMPKTGQFKIYNKNNELLYSDYFAGDKYILNYLVANNAYYITIDDVVCVYFYFDELSSYIYVCWNSDGIIDQTLEEWVQSKLNE